MKFIGLKLEQLPKYHCYRLIARMKADERW
jgi:hypothetical protein